MLNNHEIKRERVHLRLDASAKRKLERAAAYANLSVSEFVLSQALTAAEEVIESHERIVLGAEDWGVFLDALENPPEPNERLKALFRWQAEQRIKK